VTASSGSGGVFDLERRKTEQQELEGRMSAPDFWDNQERAQIVVEKLKSARAVVEPFEAFAIALDDADVLLQLGAEEEDTATIAEAGDAADALDTALERLEFRTLLAGPLDEKGAFLQVNAGAGGTESCDWAEMLLRMYTRWAERMEFGCDVLDLQRNDEAGIRSALIEVKGPYVYGYLKNEAGVHRLVRISPFDAQSRRQTTFASVDVTPLVDDSVPLDIKDADLEIDTFKAGGAGGQHVNKTESAVRIRHLPSGVVVACQNERSQHRNRKVAMQMLKAKLLRLEEEKRSADAANRYDEKGEISWGNQIRSYVLHPYQMVKDHRTKHESGNVEAVLDGKLLEFMEAMLREQTAGDG
jgi:peptide chain release factor 2